jgi:hypothetical protein
MRFDSAELSSDLDLRLLGDDEALGYERAVPDQQQRRRQHELHPHSAGHHQPEVHRDQSDEDRTRDRERRTGGKPRQQHDEVRGDQQEQQHLDPVRPRGRNEEVLLQDRRYRVRERSAPAAIDGEIGVTWLAPRPGAVAPISTIRSA